MLVTLHNVTDRRTDGQTNDMMMPVAVRSIIILIIYSSIRSAKAR